MDDEGSLLTFGILNHMEQPLFVWDGLPSNVTIQMVDMTGKILRAFSSDTSQGQELLTGFSKGMYHLVLKEGGGVLHTKYFMIY